MASASLSAAMSRNLSLLVLFGACLAACACAGGRSTLETRVSEPSAGAPPERVPSPTGGAPLPMDIGRPLERVIAAGAALPPFWIDISQRVSSAYSGPLLRIVRASDDVELDVGHVAAGDTLDVSAIAAHCARTDCFVHTAYDQTGHGRHFTQQLAASRPKIWDENDGLIEHAHGTPAIYFGGMTATWLECPDHGLTGASSLTAAFDADNDFVLDGWSAIRMILQLEGPGPFHALHRGLYPTGSFRSGHHRKWPSRPLQDGSGYIYAVAPGAPLESLSIEQNGVALDNSWRFAGDVSSPQETLSLSGAARWGARGDAGEQPWTGRSSSFVAWPHVLEDEALDIVRAYHEGIVGDGEQSFEGGPLVIVAGQSNAEAMEVLPPSHKAPFPGDLRIGAWFWTQAAYSGTSTGEWQPDARPAGVSLYAQLRDLALRADPDERLAILWIQGEANATDEGAAVHRAELSSLMAALRADLGRDFLWIDVLLHADSTAGTPSGRAQVNADKIVIAASRGVHGATIDPSPLGELYDGVHYFFATQENIQSAAQAILADY